MKKEIPKSLQSIKGLVTKRTKNGLRYLLHDKDFSGKDIYVTLEITDTTPKEKYSEIIQTARIKLNAKKSCISFESLLSEYFTTRNLAERTRIRVSCSLRGYGLDNKKNRENVLSLLQDNTKKQSTKRQSISEIGRFFRWLILNQKIQGITDPTQDIRIKDNTPPRSRTLTEAETEYIFEHLRERRQEDQLVIRMAYFTGARISSIYALKTDSIRNGKVYYKNVKCGRDYKYPVPIRDKETIDLFRRLAKRGYIFSDSYKTLQFRVNHWLCKVGKGKDINGEKLSIHSLRHTFATRAIQAGIAPEIVARLLDHSSINTTLRIYAKHSQEQLEQAIDRMF